ALERTIALREINFVVGEDLLVVRLERQRLDSEDRAVLRVSRALQRRDGGKIFTRRPPHGHAALPLSEDRLTFWRPCASKFAGSSQRSNAALRAGHSLSRIEYQAVSRFCPFTTWCWRNRPSYVNPKRSAARFDGSLRLLHFHS